MELTPSPPVNFVLSPMRGMSHTPFPLLVCFVLSLMRVIRVMHVIRVMSPYHFHPANFVRSVTSVIRVMHDIRFRSSPLFLQ